MSNEDYGYRMLFKDYEPFLAMLEMAGPVEDDTKLQSMVYILHNLDYPFSEDLSLKGDFSLYNWMYSERLALKIERMKGLRLIEEKDSVYKISDETSVDVEEFKKWYKCIKELNKKSVPELLLLAVYLYLYDTGSKGKEADNELVKLKFVSKDKKETLSCLRNDKKNLEELCCI